MKSKSVHISFGRGISSLALAIGLLASGPALAQSTSTLRGHVEAAPAGSTVTATDITTGQKVTATIGADGNYFIAGLRPSTYRVSAAGSPPQDVSLQVGQTIAVDFEGKTGASNEIVVTAGRVSQVRTATVSTNVSPAQIENLPQNDRNFLNFAALAPGVNVTQGDHQVQAGAVSSAQTNVFIDGLSLKNPINHGGIVGQNFSPGNPFAQLAVQEFAVDTQNFKAEYEQAGSAIITAVTKTGGEDFHGDAFIEWQPKSFIGRPFFDRPGQANNPTGANLKPDYDRKQYGADIGGPIIKNVLHFYFAFEGTTTRLPSGSVNLNPADNVPVALATQYNGTFPQNFKQKLYFGKLTLFATANDTIDGSASIRQEQNLRDFGGNSVPSHGHNISSNVEVYQLHWKHRGADWLNELTGAYSFNTNGTPRTGAGPEIVLERGPALGSGDVAFLGANSFVQNDRETAFTLKDNVTLYRGDHIVKFGGKVSLTKLARTEDNKSNGSYFFNAATFTDFNTQNPVAAQVSTIPVLPASANNTQIGVFVQDDWTPDIHWTVSAGLRWDYETNAKNEKFVTPANVATSLRAYQGWAAAGINPEDYISTGSNRYPFAGAFQPRLSVSYDVKGDRDLVLFGGAGRYYDRPLFIEAGIETIKNLYQSVTTLNFCNGTGVVTPPPGCVTFTPGLRDLNALRALAIAQGTGGEIWLLNNNTKLPYSDEFDIGVRKRFGKVQTSITLSYIKSKNLFQFVRGNRLPDGSYPSYNGTPVVIDNFPQQGILPGFSGKLNIGQNNGEAHYLALYLTADKPYTEASRWGFSAALTLQRPRTNDGTELNADEFFAGPRVDQFGTQDVNGVEKWRFVGTGIVGLPWNIMGSSTVTLSSGPSFGSLYGFGLPTSVGNQCCIANLGGLQYPSKFFGYANVDVRLAKTFKMPWGHDLTIDFQAYNVFDFVNRNYSSWGAGFRGYNSGTNTFSAPPGVENGTTGSPRSFQVGVKYKF